MTVYPQCAAATAGCCVAAAELPHTGSSTVWLALGGFALLTAGGALIRTAPSLHRRPGAPALAVDAPRRVEL